MGANSTARRVLKRLAAPVLGTRVYRALQAGAMSWDIVSGRWREPEMDLIPLAVRPGDQVLDIGANYGVYAYHFSRAVGSQGRVYAFEPVPFTRDTLQTVIRLLRLGNVEVIGKGCGQTSGFVDFDVPIQASGAISAGQAHLAVRDDNRPGRERHARLATQQHLKCEIVALDEYLGDLRNLSFIKCDIEGAELLAFRGAQQLIRRHRPTVVCEINPWFLDGFGIRLEELLSFFTDQGYTLHRYKTEPIPHFEQIDDTAGIDEDNYVFIHSSRAAAFDSLFASIQTAHCSK